jgi:tRNA A-37 threonylcarbamoyl transferase component Bud32
VIHDWEVDGPSNRFGSLWQSYMRNGEWLGILTWRHFPDVDLDELDERAMTLRYRPEAKPGIALVIDAGVRDGKLWVLEEVETKDTVADVALNEGFDSAASLDRLVRSIGRSMEALHQQRIVHGAISADSFHLRTGPWRPRHHSASRSAIRRTRGA